MPRKKPNVGDREGEGGRERESVSVLRSERQNDVRSWHQPGTGRPVVLAVLAALARALEPVLPAALVPPAASDQG